MEKYIWRTPILPGKSHKICDEWTKNTFNLVDPEHRKVLEEMHDRGGLHDYDLWIQHTSQGDLLLFYWEVDNWDQMFEAFRTDLANGVPRAVLAAEQFMEVLGLDLSKPDVMPKPEMISHQEISKLPSKQVVRVAFAWPISEDRLESRREFADSLDHENKRRFKRLCRHLGIISATRGIAHSGGQSYYMFYQEVDINMWDRYEAFLEGSYAKGEWAWEALIEDTGMTREQLTPHIEWVLDRAPVTTKKG